MNDNPKAQKYLLGAFEMLVGKSYPEELMPKAAHILKALYDNDLLEEEVLISWAQKVLTILSKSSVVMDNMNHELKSKEILTSGY